MTVRVLCLVPYPSLGASNRLRVEQYAPALRALGIELELSAFLDDAGYAILYEPGHTIAKAMAVARGLARRIRDLSRARRYDLVLVHREAALVGSPFMERALVGLGVRYLYDFDDAIFLVPANSPNPRWGWLRPPSRVAEITRLASFVVTQNEYLADWARRRNPRVAIIPTPVDTDRYRPGLSPRHDGPPVIGWVGSSTTAAYLRLLDEPLTRLARGREFVVRVIGGTYRHPDVRVECLPYRLADEPAQVAGIDIGVLPQPDDQWTRGKGAFKAILYMASGVPVVASRSGVTPDVVPHGVVGYCVGDDDEWVKALAALLADPALRARLGSAGRERAVERYSVRALAPRLAAAINEAAQPNVVR